MLALPQATGSQASISCSLGCSGTRQPKLSRVFTTERVLDNSNNHPKTSSGRDATEERPHGATITSTAAELLYTPVQNNSIPQTGNDSSYLTRTLNERVGRCPLVVLLLLLLRTANDVERVELYPKAAAVCPRMLCVAWPCRRHKNENAGRINCSSVWCKDFVTCIRRGQIEMKLEIATTIAPQRSFSRAFHGS